MPVAEERRTVAANADLGQILVLVAVIGLSEEREQRHVVPAVAAVDLFVPSAQNVDAVVAELLRPVERRADHPVARARGIGGRLHGAERSRLVAGEVVEEDVGVAVLLVHARCDAVTHLSFERQAGNDMPRGAGVDRHVVAHALHLRTAFEVGQRVHPLEIDAVVVVSGLLSLLAGIFRDERRRCEIDVVQNGLVHRLGLTLRIAADEHVDEHHDVLVEVHRRVGAHRQTFESVVHHLVHTVLIEILRRQGEARGGVTARHGEVVLVDRGRLAHRLLHPVGAGIVDRVAPLARDPNLFGGILVHARGIAVGLVDILHVGGSVDEVGQVDRLLNTEITVVRHRNLAGRTAFGRDEDNAVTGFGAVDRRSGGVFEDRHRLDGRGIELVHVELEAVDQHQRVGTQKRRHAADLDRRTVTARKARTLSHQDTRRSALQGLRQTGDGLVFEIGGRHRADRSGDMLALLRSHTRHHDLVDTGQFLLHCDRKVGHAFVHPILFARVPDKRKGEHVAVFGLDREESFGVGRRSANRSLHEHRHAHQRRGRVFRIYDDAPDIQQFVSRPRRKGEGGGKSMPGRPTGRPDKTVRAESRRLSTGSLLV